nr:hypothetical protein BaRGS_007429 [Batillaria attramentaria]
MRTCWADNPLDRPTFTELREQLEDLMAEDRNYLVLEEFDVPLSASESSSNPTTSELFASDMRPSQTAMEAVSGSSESNSSASAAASASAAGLLRQAPALRRPPMTIDVCIHQKSTERLMRPSESDSSP